MTVAELIDLLRKLPQDAAVYVDGVLVSGAEHDEFFNCVDIHVEER